MTLKHFDPSKVTHVPMLERLGGMTPASEMGLTEGPNGWTGAIDDNLLEACKGTYEGEECGSIVSPGETCAYCGTLCPKEGEPT